MLFAKKHTACINFSYCSNLPFEGGVNPLNGWVLLAYLITVAVLLINGSVLVVVKKLHLAEFPLNVALKKVSSIEQGGQY
ncbi:MAG: hypothetical protein R2795_19325 [Saprospiraceae bacterium]